MTDTLFKGSSHSSIYNKYRPSPPDSLIEYLVSRVKESRGDNWDKEKTAAVDIGCGTGQCTQLLSRYFDSVYGLDISETQVAEATRDNQHSNISYQVSPAESTPLEPKSVDLVTCAQAFHWFKHEEFFKEVKRISKPNGVLAVISYEVPNVLSEDGQNTPDDLKYVVKKFRDDFASNDETKGFWRREANWVEQQYSGIALPFGSVEKKHFDLIIPATGSDVIGYLETWSCNQKIRKDDEGVYNRLMDDMKRDIIRFSNRGTDDISSIRLNLSYEFTLISGLFNDDTS